MQAVKRKIVLFCAFVCALTASRICAQGTSATLDRQGWKDSVFHNREKAALVQKEREINRRLQEFRELQAAKLSLLNGKLDAARKFLGRAGQHSGQFEAIQIYYRALIAFIQNRFEDSLKLISGSQFNSFENYPHICVLRLVNQMALGDFQKFGREKTSCTLSTETHAYQEHLWPEVLTDMHYQRTEQREKMRNWNHVLAGLDESRDDDRGGIYLWAKGMLFLNLSAFESGVGGLSDEISGSQTMRELTSFYLYRQSRFEEAFKMIEGMSEPIGFNTQNVLGNLFFKRGEYAKAFKRFETSLKGRPYSVDTLQKAIALAFKLRFWKEGAGFVGRLHKTSFDSLKTWLVDTAFQIRLENFDSAWKQVIFLQDEYGTNYPHIVGLMKTYVALRRKDQATLQESADFECRRFDGLSCWIAMRSLGQDNFGATIDRDEETLDSEFSIEALKKKAQVTPMQEPILVDQRVVEELDFRALKLSPGIY